MPSPAAPPAVALPAPASGRQSALAWHVGFSLTKQAWVAHRLPTPPPPPTIPADKAPSPCSAPLSTPSSSAPSPASPSLSLASLSPVKVVRRYRPWHLAAPSAHLAKPSSSSA